MATEVRSTQVVVAQDAPSNPPEVRNTLVVVGSDAPSNPPEVRNALAVVGYEGVSRTEMLLARADFDYRAADYAGGVIPNRGRAGPADSTVGGGAVFETGPARIECDGGDYIQHPIGSNPADYLTPSSGQFSVLTVIKQGSLASTRAIFGTSSFPYEGVAMYLSGGNAFVATARATGTGLVNRVWGSEFLDEGVVRAFGAAVDNGDLYAFNSRDGLEDAPGDISGLVDLNFGSSLSTASGSGNGDAAASGMTADWYATLIWRHKVLTAEDLDLVSAYLLAEIAADTPAGSTLTQWLGNRRRRIGTI